MFFSTSFGLGQLTSHVKNENATHGLIKIVSLPGQIAQQCPLIEVSFAYSFESGVVAIGVCTRIGTYDVLES